MMRNFSMLDGRKFLPFAIFFIVMVALCGSALLSVADLVSLRSTLSEETELLVKLKDKADQLNGLSELKPSEYLIEAASQGIATAELQRRVSEILADAGANLQLSEIIPPDTETGTGRLAIAVNFEIEEERLIELLFKVENAKPAFLIERISVRPITSEPSASNNRLEGTATIVAAWRAPS